MKKSRATRTRSITWTRQLDDAGRLFAEGKLDSALAAYDGLIAAHPAVAEAHFNRAVVLCRQGRTDEAVAGFLAALSLRPGWTAALLALGHLEFQRSRYRDAEAWFKLAAEAAPSSAEAHCNLGLSQSRQLHPRRALPALRRARELAPDRAEAWIALHHALNMVGQEEESLADFLQFEKRAAPSAQVIAAALEIARVVPSDELERRYLPLAITWPYGAADLGALSNILGNIPFFDIPPEAAFALYRTYDRLAQASRLNVTDLAQRPVLKFEGRLRIGYLSADFRNHVMGRILDEVIARHDAAAFEIRLYSLAPPGGEDALTARLVQRTAGLKHLVAMPDYNAARAIADDQIHILVDLMGHTSWAQPGILLFKPAPVIVTHLGFHGTVGLRQVDFKITDAVADLPDAGMFQIERPLPMSGSIIPIRQIEGVRAMVSTIDAKVVFGASVSLQKTSPRCLSAWKRILERVPDSMLMFSPHHEWQRPFYLRRVEYFGIDPRRVVFLSPTFDEAQDRGRYGAVDVMLDTFPYTGGDSAACAMAEGVPLVTLCGRRHPERVATSVLTHLGITDTIAQTVDEYVELAVRLARDRPWRDAVAAQIRAALPGHDAAMTAYTRSLEAALREAWRS
jgi:predicted O-linked N-acetylglucosamine transferase (SPINDLY family)